MPNAQTIKCPARVDLPLHTAPLRRADLYPSGRRAPPRAPALPQPRRHADTTGDFLKRLEPSVIRPSPLAHRHPDSYADAKFKALRADIKAKAGNLHPVLVRPLPGVLQYELCWGYRRWQACAQERLPVLAIVEEMCDSVFFERMHREGMLHKDLSPYERGVMCRNALNGNIYANAAQLAKALDTDPTSLGRVLVIADLEQRVLDAFPSPNLIQYAWARRLKDAYDKNPQAVLDEAARLAMPGSDDQGSPTSIFERLIAAPTSAGLQVAATSAKEFDIQGASAVREIPR